MSEFEQKLHATLEAFIASPDFKTGVKASTRASWSCELYKVDLFDNGHWRLIWHNMHTHHRPGSCPGILISLPIVNDSGMNDYINARIAGRPNAVEELVNGYHVGLVDDYLEHRFARDKEYLAYQLRSNFHRALVSPLHEAGGER